jgi:alkanesulfonate monooxygenase SsuD/methylene tetrahydromethanopterin reductase-like flavin-dependent oxidoreductase (luciferase family)
MRRSASRSSAHHGKFWSFDDLHVVPRPLQQPFPPVWVPVISAESAERGGPSRRQDLYRLPFGTSRVQLIFDAYRAEAERSGFPAGPDQLALRRRVDVARAKSAGSRSFPLGTRVAEPDAEGRPTSDGAGGAGPAGRHAQLLA